MSVAVGIPISRKFDWRTSLSHFGLISDMRGEIEFIAAGNHERFMAIEKARCNIAQRFMKGKSEWLFFFDSDATSAPGTLKRLLSWDKPIVSALCFKRRQIVTPAFQFKKVDDENFNPYVSLEHEHVAKWISKYGELNVTTEIVLPNPPEGSLIEVDRVGTHCLLIHRDVIEAIPEPRFERTTPPDSGATGSDYDFCVKARHAGFKIHVDLSVISGHMDGTHILSGMDCVRDAIYMAYVKRDFMRGR